MNLDYEDETQQKTAYVKIFWIKKFILRIFRLIGILSEEEYEKIVKMHEDERKKNLNEAIKLRQSKTK